MGLKRAVIVVGGWGGVRETGAIGEEEGGGIWKEGGVASGNVVKRIPVDTIGPLSEQGLQKKKIEYLQRSSLVR